jgi:hypothetical protein
MNFYNVIKRRDLKIGLLFLSMLILCSRCIYIDDLIQPQTSDAGKIITITLKIRMHPLQEIDNAHIIIGILAPSSWNATANTTMTYESSKGNGTLVKIPDNIFTTDGRTTWPVEIMDKVGIGPNELNDLEWTTFWTKETYSIASNDPDINGTVQIKTKVGKENSIFKLGYFAGNTINGCGGSTYTIKYKDFKVIGANTPIIDYCTQLVSSIVPLHCDENDIITITFDGNAKLTKLSDAHALFFSAKGFTYDGDVYEKSDKTLSSKFAPIGNNKWRLQISPRRFFKIKNNQSLKKIEYYYTDITGRIVVGSTNKNPFVFTFNNN